MDSATNRQPRGGGLRPDRDRARQLQAAWRLCGGGDARSGQQWLADPVLGDCDRDALALTLARSGDPRQATLALLRLAGECRTRGYTGALTNLLTQPQAVNRLAAVLGASQALGDFIITHPWVLAEIGAASTIPSDLSGSELTAWRTDWAEAATARITAAMQTPQPGSDDATTQLRFSYRCELLRVAAADLTSADALAIVANVGWMLAHLTEVVLTHAHTQAVAAEDPAHATRLGVIALGKTGGRELNYISDVDLIYLHADSVGGQTTSGEVLATATRVATRIGQICGGGPSTGTCVWAADGGGAGTALTWSDTQAALWPIDTGLRPEGKDGALVRTLESARDYYQRWAQSWEFQALLKARPVGGDRQVGEEFVAATRPLVWEAATRPGFVADARQMRRRVEETSRGEAELQLKLGPGGLRDIEFPVQLLQLVHGRADTSVRVANTWEAISALVEGAYLGRETGRELLAHYRFERVVEHRIQLQRLVRSHTLPKSAKALTALARAANIAGVETEAELLKKWEQTRRAVRAAQQAIFYRPLLPATAQLAASDLSLTADAATDRLQMLGYRDPAGAMRHILALTTGLSRRAMIQRNLLPVILGWLADGADADAGLLNFRTLSESIGDSHWFLGFLRDSPWAAQKLAQLLASARYINQGLQTQPQAVRWLDAGDDLVLPGRDQISDELAAIGQRYDDAATAIDRIRAVRGRELLRTAIFDALNNMAGPASGAQIAMINEVTIAAMVRALGGTDDICLVAMGGLGGAVSLYGSDCDLIAIATSTDIDRAITVASQLREAGRGGSSYPPIDIDFRLRPEGRNGPLARSLQSYAAYYDSWLEAWERQALLRARPITGPEATAAQFRDLIDPLRYPEQIPAAQVRQIRVLKARMENERLPRGVDPKRHLKLGPGGMSDIEWVVQLLQLRHAHAHPQLRVTGTLPALAGCVEVGLLSAEQGQELEDAYRFAQRVRAANVLASGRVMGPKLDVLPADTHSMQLVGYLMGYGHSQRDMVEEDYRIAARRARAVFDAVFYCD